LNTWLWRRYDSKLEKGHADLASQDFHCKWLRFNGGMVGFVRWQCGAILGGVCRMLRAKKELHGICEGKLFDRDEEVDGISLELL